MGKRRSPCVPTENKPQSGMPGPMRMLAGIRSAADNLYPLAPAFRVGSGTSCWRELTGFGLHDALFGIYSIIFPWLFGEDTRPWVLDDSMTSEAQILPTTP